MYRIDIACFFLTLSKTHYWNLLKAWYNVGYDPRQHSLTALSAIDLHGIHPLKHLAASIFNSHKSFSVFHSAIHLLLDGFLEWTIQHCELNKSPQPTQLSPVEWFYASVLFRAQPWRNDRWNKIITWWYGISQAKQLVALSNKASGVIARQLDSINWDLLIGDDNRHNPKSFWKVMQLIYFQKRPETVLDSYFTSYGLTEKTAIYQNIILCLVKLLKIYLILGSN